MGNTQQSGIAVLMLNIGSPKSPSIVHVMIYLSRFLGERRILGIPWLLRKLLVNCFILPCYAFRSKARYTALWQLSGKKFPLVHYGLESKKLLQEALGDQAEVFLGMCYGSPEIKENIHQIEKKGFSKLILLPLFPHYASSSTGIALERAMQELSRLNAIPEIRSIQSFYQHPAFIEAWVEQIRNCHPENYDCIVFTYHSIPIKQALDVENTTYCYRSACLETTRLIAQRLSLPKEQYETAFQSQLSTKWQGPFVDQLIMQKAQQGVKSILIVPASFIADCLETTIELGIEYKEKFLTHGGERLDSVPCLNDKPLWIEALKELILDNSFFT